jgi:hypothetical protein
LRERSLSGLGALRPALEVNAHVRLVTDHPRVVARGDANRVARAQWSTWQLSPPATGFTHSDQRQPGSKMVRMTVPGSSFTISTVPFSIGRVSSGRSSALRSMLAMVRLLWKKGHLGPRESTLAESRACGAWPTTLRGLTQAEPVEDQAVDSGFMGWWQRAPWGDRNRVGVRLAWANALVVFVVVLVLVIHQLF